MSVKQYGIYLCYAPTVDLRCEGLGRYLAAFLKGATTRDDVQFVIVCPNWSKEGLLKLFENEGVPESKFKIITPEGKPYILRIYEACLALKTRSKKISLFQRVTDKLQSVRGQLLARFENNLARTYIVFDIAKLSLESFAILSLLLCFSPLFVLLAALVVTTKVSFRFVRRLLKPFHRVQRRVSRLLVGPKDDGLVLRLYRAMEKAEADRMQNLIDDMPQILAWYSPTAFWPNFNRIKAPRLMCVPDVVLNDFPVSFSSVGGNRFLETFELIQSAIREGEHFVTYSDAVKWSTLVDCYGISPSAVTSVHHAPNVLNNWIDITGFPDSHGASINYCQWHLSVAIRRCISDEYRNHFDNGAVNFIFYASQFRPNKNIFSLLKAYDYLLRNKFIGHKLILTGGLHTMPEIKEYIAAHGLEHDVLCLHGLSVQELAACYKLADLAVNPSLSEGGCPFTFTEALSVGTPVVMAKIPVTEEVLTDPELQQMTFFNPYDWQDMATRIEWGLNNRTQLLDKQKETYDILIQRTWTDVVNEHIAILDRISSVDTKNLNSELVV